MVDSESAIIKTFSQLSKEKKKKKKVWRNLSPRIKPNVFL